MNSTAVFDNPGAGGIKSGASIPFDAIQTPGCYVCNWSGHLLRVSRPAVVPEGVINIVGGEPLFVTKIADDPLMPLIQARAAAAALCVKTCF